jgi:hypothetical protein
MPATPTGKIQEAADDATQWFTNARFVPISRIDLPLRELRPQNTPIASTQPTVASTTPSRQEQFIKQALRERDACYSQKAEDSANRTWCHPVQRDIKLKRVAAFHNAMHDESTLEVDHCKFCYQQKAPKNIMNFNWERFEPLYLAIIDQIPISDRGHFACYECFPRSPTKHFGICQECDASLARGVLPFSCRVNNMALGCIHRYPDALKHLSPLEERLIGIYAPCGWITKLTIDVEKWTSGRYRKHKRGHITVFPNDVQGVAAQVLPHPLVEERERLHICFVGPRKPVPSDLAFMLSVNPQKIKRALAWLKAHNPLYKDIQISEDHLASWADCCAGTEVPQELVNQMVSYDVRPEDEIRTGHYVSPAERGRPDEPIRTAEEVLASLEDRTADASRLEAESNARLGGIYAGEREIDEMEPRHIEQELSELVSTGLMATEAEGEYSPRERLRILRKALTIGGRRYRGRKPRGERQGVTLWGNDMEPYIINRHGEDLVNPNDVDFFPKTFPCLFPWGRGGPKALEDEEEQHEFEAQKGGVAYKTHNFYLRTWARHLLRRHGRLL